MLQASQTASGPNVRVFSPKFSALSLAVSSLFVQLGAQTLPAVTITSEPDYLPDAGIATKTDTPSREAPFASSTVGRALLQERGVTKMNDALATVPGVAAVNGIGNFNARPGIRLVWPV